MHIFQKTPTILLLFLYFLVLSSCSSNTSQMTSETTEQAKVESSQPQKIKHSEDICSLTVPDRSFVKKSKDLYVSDDWKAELIFGSTFTDLAGEEPAIYRFDDLIKLHRKALSNVALKKEGECFTLQGKKTDQKYVYIKACYNEFGSMQGNMDGDSDWLWSMTGSVTITYSNQKKREIEETLIPRVVSSFSCELFP